MVYFGINLLSISQGQLLIEMLLLGNRFYFIFFCRVKNTSLIFYTMRTMFTIILFFSCLVRVAIGLTGNGINRDGTDSTDPYDL